MTQLSPTRYSDTEARTRFEKARIDAVRVPFTPLKMTATLKRRAPKKRPDKREFVAPPAVEVTGESEI
jgi:hypothetical protein